MSNHAHAARTPARTTKKPLSWRTMAMLRLPCWEALEARMLMSAVWTGAGNDQLWNNPNNWASIVVPVAGENVVFPSNGGNPEAVNLTSNVEVGDITIDGDYQFNDASGGSGAAITVDGAIASDGLGSSIGNVVVLTQNTNIDVAAGDDLTMGEIDDGGNGFGITKTGGGLLFLGSNNDSYSGATEVAGGTLEVDTTLDSAVTVDSGALLEGTGQMNEIDGNGGIVSLNDASGNPAALSVAGSVSLANSTLQEAISPSSNGESRGLLTATGSIDLSNASLNVTVANNYMPPLGDSFTLISNPNNNPITGTFIGLAEGAATNINGVNYQVSYSGGSSGHDVTLTVVPDVWTGAAGNSNWFDAGNWQSGVAPAAGDTVVFPDLGMGSTTIEIGGPVTVNDIILDGTYVFNDTSGNNAATITVDGGITSNNTGSSINNGLILTQDTIVTVGASDDLTLAGIDDGGNAYGILKAGSGTLFLSSATDSYSGVTEVATGTLEVDAALSSSVTVDSGATLDGSGAVNGITDDGGAISLGTGSSPTTLGSFGSITLGSGSTFNVSALNGFSPALGQVITLISNQSGNAVTGTFAGLAEGAATNINGVNYQVSYTGGNSGNAVTLTVVPDVWTGAAGSHNWSDAGNWQSGVIPASGDVIVLPNLGSNQIINLTIDVTVGDLTLSGNYSINNNGHRLIASGAIRSSAGSSSHIGGLTVVRTTILNVGSAGALRLDSVFGTSTLIKTGPGLLEFNGAPDNYTGNILVAAGTLEVDVTLGSQVTLSAGTILQGVGSVDGVTDNGGTVMPGINGDAGVLAIGGGLTLDSNSTFSAELDGNTAGNGRNFYGQISSNGSVDLNDAALSLSVGPDYVPATGDVLTLISNPNSTTTGSFAGLPQGATLTLGAGNVFRISYTGGTSGQDVTLTYVRDTTVTVTSSAGPSVFGQSVTFTAAVTPADGLSGIATGTVTFFDNGVAIGSAVTLNGNAEATISDSNLVLGSDPITATYSGDVNYFPNTSGAFIQAVNQSPTTVNISSSNPTAAFGETVSYSVTAAAAGNGSGTPDGGTVTLTDENSNVIGTGTLSNGAVSIDVSSLVVGSHTVTATYTNDADFASNSDTTAETINAAATTTAVTSSGTPTVAGQSVTFTAGVSVNAPGIAAVSGTVAFFNDDLSHQIGATQNVVSGVATVTTTSLTQGDNNIFAVFTPTSGDDEISGSTSATIVQGDNQASTTTAVTSSNATSVFGESVALTAQVTANSPGSGTPSGTVTFYDGLAQLGDPVALSNGSAVLNTSALSVATHSITAVYSGDTDFATSDNTSSALTQTVNQAVTTTTITADHSPSSFGQSVTFTATIGISGNGAGSPTGTVTFSIDGVPQAPVNLSGNTAAFTLANLSRSVHSIDAVYNGDSNLAGSSAASFAQNVQRAPTVETVISANPAAVFGEPVTLTATVTAVAPGAGIPASGTFIFFVDGNAIGTSNVVNGSATLANVTLPVGNHDIQAHYGGNGSFGSGSSSHIQQSYAQADTTTTVTSDSTFSNNAYQSVYGQTVTLSATVAARGAGAGTPTGTVTFMDGGVTLGTGTLSNGVATFSSTTLGSFLALGDHSITASYGDDANFNASDSTGAPITQTVAQASTTATVASSPGTSTLGQDVTLTATIAAQLPGDGTPTGTVTFFSDNVQLGDPQSLSSGTASLDVSDFSVATHSITIVYSGDTNYITSTSSALSQTVNQATPVVSVSSTAQNSAVFGQSVTLSATVTSNAGSPTGTVTFFDGTTAISSALALVNGSASVDTSALTTGTHAITAIYSGDGNFNAQTSANFSQVINQSTTATAVVSSLSPGVSGQTVHFTATVTAAGLGAGTPTGTVTFFDGNTAIGSPVALSGNTASISTAALSTAGHSITAVYNGDGDFLTSTSPGLSQTQNQDASSVTLDTAGVTSVFGANPTLTATVTADAPGSGTPTGFITFYDGSGINAVALGQGILSGGVATLSNYALAAGSHTLSVVYSGDTDFVTSTSTTTNYTVTVADTSVAVTGDTAGEFGQLRTVTATVSLTSGGGIPTGSIEFFDNGAALGTVAMTNGSASLTQGYSVGSHPITATYVPAGDNFNGSETTSSHDIVITAASTSTTLASTTPTVFGESATLTATVAISGNGVGILSGLVSFFDGNNLLDSVNVIDGQASFSSSALSVGDHSITAVYGSDANFASSTASAVTQTVNESATTTAVSSSDASAVFGEHVTLTAVVAASSPGAGTPNTGIVTFYADGNISSPLGTGQLSNGSATLSNVTLPVGDHSITASYGGDGTDFLSSNSASTDQIFAQASTSLSLTVPTTVVHGQTATLTATVSILGLGAGVPTGNVVFYADGNLQNPIGTASLNSGSASVTVSSLNAATHDITAVYVGDGNFITSSATSVSQVVNRASTTLTLGSTTASIFGSNATLTATVAAVAPGAGTPTGTVFFYADGSNTALGQATVSGGVATLQNSSVFAGDHVITASYVGDDNFVQSDGTSSVTQHVNQSPTTTTLQVAPTNVFGQNIAFTATVVASGGGGGIPTGQVLFFDHGGTQLGSATIQNGQAVLHDSNLAVGSHSVRAVYAGDDDSNYLISNSLASSVAVNRAATTVGLISSTNPSTFNQSTTFTATVLVTSPGSTIVTVPTGTVTFFDNGVSIGSGTPDVTGVVTLSTSSLAVSQSSHPITATYSGDGNFLAGNSSTLNQTVNKATPGISVSSTAQNSAVFGQTVTLSATVASIAGTPTGTVTFFDGNIAIGSPVTLVSGSASVVSSALPTGTDAITATYSGDGNFNTRTSENFSQVINRSTTATAVVSSLSPVVAGQTVTFTATVTAAGQGAGTPTGTVIFESDGIAIGDPVALSNGTASISTAALSTAGHSITAIYSGSGDFLTSTSPGLSQTQNQDASSVTLNAAGITSVFGANPTLTATVAADAPGSGTPTGSVTFYDGTGSTAVALGQSTLSGGIATLSNYALAAGSHSLSVVYSGDTDFVTSTSTTTSYTVTAADTSVAVTGATAGKFGQSLTVTGIVTLTSGSGVATGSIEFFDNGAALGTVAMVNGSASLTAPYTVGSHPITATYIPAGDNFSGSTTLSSHDISVSPALTSTTLSSTTPVVFGESATLTATVAIAGNGAGIPTGNVVFYADNDLQNPIGTASLSSGAASITVSSLSVATHGITAVYAGDDNFVTSAASSIDQVVNKSDTTTTVTSDSTFTNGAYQSVYGQPITFSATVAAGGAGAGTPTGTVTFMDGSVTLGTGTLTNGVATFSSTTLGSFLASGVHSITASYGDDASFNASDSTAAPITQSIGHASTSLALTAPTAVVFGQSATLTATVGVVGLGDGLPTGNVVFYADGDLQNPIGTASLASGSASITVSSLTVATHGITATYVGDANFVTSTATRVDQVVNKSDTAVTVTTDSTFSNNAYQSVYGQTVIFSATVAASGGGAGTTTGAVTFMDGNVTLGTRSLINGVARLSSTSLEGFLALGGHTITASYAGDGEIGNFNASNSAGAPITQTVGQASTLSTVTSSLGASAFGQGITLTGVVGSQLPGHGTPTGTVTFFSDNVQIGEAQTLSRGVATLDVADLPVAIHSITIVYSGDTNYATSTSSGTSQEVDPANTTIALTSSNLSPVSGETVTLTAVVAPIIGAMVPTGTVTFFDNNAAIGTAQAIANGQVSITTILPLNANSLTASYTNTDGNFNGSTTDSPVSNPVSQDAVTVGVTSSVNASTFGQSSSYVATVVAAGVGSGTPTGTVTFFSDGSRIGTADLSNGVATLASGVLLAGTHDIAARYDGSADFLTGATPANALSQVVNQSNTTLTLGSTTTSIFGSNATITATVAAVAPGAGTPTGTVFFYADGSNTALGQATVSGGVATLQNSSLIAGDHVITASYAGDDNFVQSNTSSSVTQHVNESPTTTTLQVAPAGVFGQTIAFTATVVASGGGAGSPTGQVIFFDQNGNSLGSATIQDGQAVLRDSNLAVGSYSVRAVYEGSDDSNYLASNSARSAVTVSRAAVVVRLFRSANPSSFNQSVTFTAVLSVTSPGSTIVAVPTGTVTFFDNGVSIGSASPDVTGTATLTTSSLAVSQSTHPITAIYSGDGSFLAGSSPTLNQTVNKATAGVSVTSTAQDSAVFGQSVTLSAAVTSIAGTPTGTVTFFDGNTAIGSPVALVNGLALVDTSALSTGTHSITATYSGDGNFNTRTSENFSQVINQSTTATAVVSNLSPAVSGQTVTFTATVTAAGLGAGTPTGTVIFESDGIAIGDPVALSSGTASISTAALSTAGHSITAIYSGNRDFLTSAAPGLSQTQNQDASSVTLDTAGVTSVFGTNPTLTATVIANAPGSGTPTGSVTFYDGSGMNAVALGQGTLSGGIATLSNYALAAGSRTLSVVYSGDTDFLTSTSTPTSYTVTAAGTSVAVTGADAGEFGQPLTVTGTVSVISGSGTPTGSIAFFDNGVALSTVAMSGHSASLTVPYTVGSHPITATYIPIGGNFSGSTATSSHDITISSASTSTTLASTTPTVFGQSATFTATVAISGNGVGTLGGQVSFFDGNTLLGAGTVTNGHASLSSSALSVGIHSITATYAGDGHFNTSTSTSSSVRVDIALPTLSVSSPTVTEASNGAAAAAFTVSLSAAATVPVTVNYATVDGTATAASGAFVASSGSLVFAPGVTTRQVTVQINGTSTPGTNQTFRLALSGPSNATLLQGSGTATIINQNFANPVVTDVSVVPKPGASATLLPLASAHSNDGLPLTLTILSQPTFGTASVVTVNGVQTLFYKPNAGAVESDRFNYQVTDGHGHSTTGHAGVFYQGAGLVVSSLNPSQTDLVVVGTTNPDNIRFVQGRGNSVKVMLNGINAGTFAPTGRIIAFGEQLNDTISAAGVGRSCWFYGEGGNNILTGGAGSDVLIGGTGNDALAGNGGRNILIGGDGADTLKGTSADILIAGSTIYDPNTPANQASLNTILAAWQNRQKTTIPTVGGVNGGPAFSETTITADDSSDILIGTKSSWFFGDFTFNGGSDTFSDGRHAKAGKPVLPTAKELVTAIPG